MGRDALGGNAYTYFELPTAGLANGTTAPGYDNALALLRGLRVTEIMYNAFGGNDYEYIELKNVGLVPLQLAGVKFVEGIDFTFDSLTMNSGDSVVVAANPDVFRTRYGSKPRVLGPYGGKLDNSGETLAIQLPPPFDANILTFGFKDSWQVTSDGLGKSLVVTNSSLSAGLWGDKDTWTYSASPFGDPDAVTIAPPDHFVPWLAHFGLSSADADFDTDGLKAIQEYGLGSNPTGGQAGNGALVAPSIEITPEGALKLRFEAPHNPAVVQAHGPADLTYIVEASSDLVTWTMIAMKTPASSWSGSATAEVGMADGGLVPVTIVQPTPLGQIRFLRLRTTLLQ